MNLITFFGFSEKIPIKTAIEHKNIDKKGFTQASKAPKTF